MYKNSSAPLNNTALWHYLGTKHLDFRCENNSNPGVLIKEIWYYIFVNQGFFKSFFSTMSVCMCVSPKLVITIHMKWNCISQSNKCYNFRSLYVTLAVDNMDGCILNNKTCHYEWILRWYRWCCCNGSSYYKNSDFKTWIWAAR